MTLYKKKEKLKRYGGAPIHLNEEITSGTSFMCIITSVGGMLTCKSPFWNVL